MVAIDDAVGRVLQHGLDASMLAEFLASIDWSHSEQAAPAVRERLGQLEMWSTEHGEGQLPTEEFRARLRQMLRSGVAG